MATDDVLRVTWRTAAGEVQTYTVHDDEDGGLCIITREPVTHVLTCHRCRVRSSQPWCDHIRDVWMSIQHKPKAED